MPEGLNPNDIAHFRTLEVETQTAEIVEALIACCDEVERQWAVTHALIMENGKLRQHAQRLESAFKPPAIPPHDP